MNKPKDKTERLTKTKTNTKINLSKGKRKTRERNLNKKLKPSGTLIKKKERSQEGIFKETKDRINKNITTKYKRIKIKNAPESKDKRQIDQPKDSVLERTKRSFLLTTLNI